MSFVRIVLAKLGKIFVAIAAVIRRAFCCIRRRRRNSDTPLPIISDVRHLTTMPVQQFPGNEGVELHNWTTWEDDELMPSSVTVIENEEKSPRTNAHGHLYDNTYNRQKSKEEEPDVDYFQDMVPKIKKPTKIMIKKHEDNVLSSEGISKRLAFDSKMAPILTTELQQWVDEDGSWEESMGDDIVCEADAALRESKLLERERRAVENLRRKQEKEVMRMSKKDHLATKIS